MGIGIGMSSNSRDSRDYGCVPQRIVEKEVIRIGSTPDPTNFNILKQQCVNGYWIYMVQYPGVTNYEGRKILMYSKNFNIDLLRDRMDPHFFTAGDSPIARFEPTKFGWKLAQTLAITLGNKQKL